MQGQLVISPDVIKALRENTAVVALESTIISHGMPYPQVIGLVMCNINEIRSQQSRSAPLETPSPSDGF